jgi:hypothetical protein
MAEDHKHEDSRAEPLAVSVVSFGWPSWAAGEVEVGVDRERKKKKKKKEIEGYEKEIRRFLSIK